MEEGIILGDAPQAAVQEFQPQLSGMGEEKVVAVFNPLPHDFRVVFSRPQAYRPTPDANLQFARDKGLPLEKSSPKAYVTQDVVLPAGKIKNLPGDIAQIAVRKLVTAIIQTRNDDGSYNFDGRGGHKNMVPDPERRKNIEAEIVKGIYDATAFFNREVQPVTTEEVTNQQIAALNDPAKEPTDVPDPAPGTGVNYTPAEALPAGAGQPDSTESTAPAKAATASKA